MLGGIVNIIVSGVSVRAFFCWFRDVLVLDLLRWFLAIFVDFCRCLDLVLSRPLGSVSVLGLPGLRLLLRPTRSVPRVGVSHPT